MPKRYPNVQFPLLLSLLFLLFMASAGYTAAKSTSIKRFDEEISNNTITLTNQQICLGTTPGLINGSTPTGGNGMFSYQWEMSTTSATADFIMAPGTNNSINYTFPVLISTTWFRRRVISATSHSYSNALQVTILPVPPAPIVANQAICSGSSATLQASSVAHSFSWYATSQGGTPLHTGETYTTPTLLQTTTFYAESKSESGCTSSTRTAVRVTVTPAVTNNSITGEQSVCQGQPHPGLTGAPAAGGTGIYSYQWERSTTGSNSDFVTVSNGNGNDYAPGYLSVTTYFRRLVFSGSCGPSISNVIQIEVQPIPPTPTISQDGTTLTASIAAERYQWKLDNQTLPATTQTITATAPGKYYVSAINKNSCSSPFSEAFQITVSGAAEEGPLAQLRLFPNPTTGAVILQAATAQPDLVLTVTNLTGQELGRFNVLRQTAQQQLDLSFLPAGLYLVQMHNDRFTSSRSLVITT